MYAIPALVTHEYDRLSEHLLHNAAHERIGLTLAPFSLAPQGCDVPGITNATVSAEAVNLWQSVSGAVAFDNPKLAQTAAIAESLERYCAAMSTSDLRTRAELVSGQFLDEFDLTLYSDTQRQHPEFPWPITQSADDVFVGMHRLNDNQTIWVPQELTGLGVRKGSARWPSTSSGLAAHRDAQGGPWLALLRATQEVLERDALAVTWLNGLGGQEIDLPERLMGGVREMGAHVHAFDLTQRWNPHPVVAVAGRLNANGLPRHAFGIACRSTYAEAIDKAWLEWAQSLHYAEYIRQTRASSIPECAADLRHFDEHAAYYTIYPKYWAELPLLKYRRPSVKPLDIENADTTTVAHADNSAGTQIEALWRALHAAGVELLYRELTTPDVAAAGLRVMRVVAPALTPLHADERAPFLGGRSRDVQWRYPNEIPHTMWPNPWPHPLG